MTSKYKASIKVRLTRVFNVAVLTGVIILAALVNIIFVIFEERLVDMTIEELTFLRKFGTQNSMYEKGSQISDQFQIMLNELDATGNFEEQVNSGEIKQTGDFYSRQWSFLITNFTENIDWWSEHSPRIGNTCKGQMEWKTKGWIQNMAENFTFSDMPKEMQDETVNTQVVDTLRFPFFNEPHTIGITYYTGWESGLAYFDGSPIDYFYCLVKSAMDAFEEGKTIDYGPTAVVPDCHIHPKNQILLYDPRCRPWYTTAWNRPGDAILVTYPSLDFTDLWITLARTIKIDKVPYGVAAIDIDTAFLQTVFQRQDLTEIQDIILVTQLDKLVLYTYDITKQHILRQGNQVQGCQMPNCTNVLDGGNDDNPEKLKTISQYLFGDEPSEEKSYFQYAVEPYFYQHQDGGIYRTFQRNGTDVNMLIITLNNTISNNDEDHRQDHVLTLAVLVPNPAVVLKRPASFYLSALVAFVTFILIMLLVWFCIFQTTHRMIRPLRNLNERMIEIMEEGDADAAEINIQESCKEIKVVEQIFKQLIQDRQFSNNDFLHKEEALAIIDLADICSNFESSEPPNHRFAGICYNNIANLQFKNGMFSVAQENYIRAIEKAEICAQEAYDKARQSKEFESPADAYIVSETFQEFKKIHAHRYYQLAMCYFKKLRYGQDGQGPQKQVISDYDKEAMKLEWDKVDNLLQDSIALYCDLRYQKRSGAWQPIFVDIIIRLIIARAFVVSQTNKPLSAHRVLDRAEKLLKMVNTGKLEIQTSPCFRSQAFLFPYDILTQKYLMHRGLIHVTQEFYDQALHNFELCLQSGVSYDPRIQKECIQQIQAILAKQFNAKDPKLDLMSIKYQSMGRDFVFLIDQTVRLTSGYLDQMSKSVLQIFDTHVLPSDRVCLIKYGQEKYAKKVFSLVVKENNQTQLRNQLVQIQEDFKESDLPISQEPDSKLFAKSIKTALAEFKNNANNKKWIIAFSTEVPCISDQSGVNYNLQAAMKLGKSNVNMLFVLFQVGNKIHETANFAQFQEVMVMHQSKELQRQCGSTECLMLIEPHERHLDAQMDQIENLRLEYDHPMIYETFK